MNNEVVGCPVRSLDEQGTPHDQLSAYAPASSSDLRSRSGYTENVLYATIAHSGVWRTAHDDQ